MKEYEVVHEIFNSCSGNQMRDVLIEEVFLEDPESYVKSRHPDRELSCVKEIAADGSLIFHLDLSGQLQRYTFTEI